PASATSSRIETLGTAPTHEPEADQPLVLAGDPALHGLRGYDRLSDIERARMPWLVGQITGEATQETGIEIAHDPLARQRLGEAIVAALIELRKVEATEINLPYLAADASGPRHYRRTLDRIEAEAAE